MKLLVAAISSMTLGVICLVASFAWPYVLPTSAVWSEEDAQQYIEGSAQFHRESFDEEVSAAEVAITREKFSERQRKLDNAIAMKEKTPGRLRLLGLIVCGVGVVILVVHQNRV